MIILHDNLPIESIRISNTLTNVYGFENEIIDIKLSKFFIPIEHGFLFDFSRKFRYNKNVLVVTQRDLYADDKSEENWVFGTTDENIAIVSTTRLKRNDGKKSNRLCVNKEKYLRRLEYIAVHEIGHSVVKSNKFEETTCVNAETGNALECGPHCPNNNCAMYLSIDIESSDKEYTIVGGIRKYDAGIDYILDRIQDNWLCDSCQGHVKLGKRY